MCGIHAVISASQSREIATNLRRCLCNRGPDHITTHETRLADGAPATHLAFTSSVLALRGDHIARQPFVDPETGSVFCWNGEAWKIRHHDVSGNDGEAVAALLNEAVKRDLEEREAAILRVLRSIDGPFAFVFFDRPSGKVYYGRDRLGRRSLVIREGGQCVVLSSITDAADPHWREVEADGIYVLDVAKIQSHHFVEAQPHVATRLEWLSDDGAADFVNIPYSEYSSRKGEVISLIYPHNTEMDLSIASALYFAARGQGIAFAGSITAASAAYTTTARVLLSGLGADELFGGYQRHATAYQRQGYSGLVDELKLDVSRLGKRNLGRDDRVMSHWGKEVRFPYLDEELVRWAIRTPAWQKCDFSNPDGLVEPGKRVLRLLALELGMAKVATEKKRAVSDLAIPICVSSSS
ncbi:putative asparagine protein [Diaporthe ampelina]|uniref:Putative asparagine protein n=1 Tax=Diaporthe ampelina TaxID=1214573 RepID=A0A0G2I7N1_9PEZI|nr:putative asparagine protein [Diaporthe ampelina]